MLNILYINHETDALGGCTHSLVNLLHAVRDEVKPLVLFRAYGMAYDYMTSLGYDCIVVPFKLNILPRKFNYVKYIPRYIWDTAVNRRAIKRLKEVVCERQIDIIHSNTSVLTIGYELSKATGIPHVWHLREFQNLDFGMKPFCGWTRFYRMLDNADATISITHAIERHFKREGNPRSYVYNDAVRSVSDICNEEKEPYFLFCGRISEAKGASDAVRIFVEFCKRNNHYTLKFLGSVNDAYKSYLLQLAHGTPSESKIEFLGYESNVKPFMAHASCFLMTSQNEAQGRVTVEAMFYGCPVIGRNSGGTKEILVDGENGMLFNTIDEGVEKLCRLVNEKGLAQGIIRHAHQTAKGSFAEETYQLNLMQIYHKIL